MSNVVESWLYIKERTNGLLSRISDKDLDYKPIETMGTLGRQLRHTADVRDIYIRSLENGEGVSWATKRMEREFETSVNRLIEYFNDLDERFNKIVVSIDLEKTIKWGDMGDPTAVACIEYMTQHEIFHQGVWVSYIQGLGLDFDIFE